MKKLLFCSVLIAVNATTIAAMPNASCYSQRGLVAHWDAVDNVGYDEHDNAATIWKDLTGNGFDWTLVSSKVAWQDGKLYFNAKVDGDSIPPGSMTAKTKSDFEYRIKTIEVVMKPEVVTSAVIFSPGYNDQNSGITSVATIDTGYMLAMTKNEKGYGCGISAGEMQSFRIVYDTSSKIPPDVVSIERNGIEQNIQRDLGWLGCSDSPALGGRFQQWIKPFQGWVYAIRIYETELLPSELQLNQALDRIRIFGEEQSLVQLPEGYSIDDNGNLVRPEKVRKAGSSPFDDVKIWYKGSAGNDVGTADTAGADGWSAWTACKLKSQTRAGIYRGEATDGGRYYWWGDRIKYQNETVKMPYANVDLGESPCFVYPATYYTTNGWQDVTIDGVVQSRPIIEYRSMNMELPNWLSDRPDDEVCENWSCVLRFRPDSAINPVSGGNNTMPVLGLGDVYQSGDKPSGINLSMNTIATLSEYFNVRIFVGDQQINIAKEYPIKNGNWVDLAVLVDGPKMTIHMAYESGEDGNKTNAICSYTQTFGANIAKPTILKRSFHLGSRGSEVFKSTFTSGVNGGVNADFHGAFHQVAFWDRTLSLDEAKEAMGRPAIVSVGLEDNDGNCEFMKKSASIRAEGDWEKLDPVMTMQNSSIDIDFTCPKFMVGLSQFLRIKVTPQSSTGIIQPVLNGKQLDEILIRPDRAVNMIKVANDVITEGDNKLTLTLVSGSKVEIDALTLGNGSFQYGNSIDDFGYDTNNFDSYLLNPICGNGKFHCRGTSKPTPYVCTYRLPEDIAGNIGGLLTLDVQNTGGDEYPVDFAVNDEVLRTIYVKGGGKYSVKVPCELLAAGENKMSFTPTSGWFNINSIKFEVKYPYHQRFKVIIK